MSNAGQDRRRHEPTGWDPPEARALRERLVAGLVARGDVRTEAVRRALLSVPRHAFVPDDALDVAYEDVPLSIGFEQTISQPAIVAIMTEALGLTGRERVLEIGTGSGYQAAVLSLLAAEVYSVEVVPALGAAARARLARLGYRNVFVRIGDGHVGWPEHAPFDRVLLTAAPEALPCALADQLAAGGVLVAPLGEEGRTQRLVRAVKSEGRLSIQELGPVVFVPMTDGPAPSPSRPMTADARRACRGRGDA